MPELTALHFGLLFLMLVVGAVLGWIFRADRCAKEKIAVNASWQEQMDSQRSEHGRLAEQNKSLMQQISQYQASQKDYSNRARELSDSLKDAFARRDELQRQIKDIRGNLEVALQEREQLQSDLKEQSAASDDMALKEKDDKIFKLSRQLTTWQSRVPPLVERYQERDREARELESQLRKAEARCEELEAAGRSDHTRIEPVNADSLPDGLDASNEPLAQETGDIGEAESMTDQIDDDVVTGNGSAQKNDDSAFAAIFSSENNRSGNDPDEWSTSVNTAQSTEAADDEPDRRDDLKEIKGIGPSIEKTLNDLGVYRFHQIAEMSEYEIDRVAEQLRGFRSRIYREDWVGQARELQYRKDLDAN